MTTIIQTLEAKRAIRIAGFPPADLERDGKPVVVPGIVSVGYALDTEGSVVDRYRQMTPEQAREAAVALLRAADVAEGGPDHVDLIWGALDNAWDDLSYRIDDGQYKHDPEGEDERAATLDGWTRLQSLFRAEDAPDEDAQYDDGKTLIAGVLYDNETGEEADPQ